MIKLNTFKKQVEAKEVGAYAAILEADPTTGKLYSHWLVELFLKGKLLTEDLPKANAYLKAFKRARNNLKPEARNLTIYKSLPELYDVVAPFLPQVKEENPGALFGSSADNATAPCWPIRKGDVIEVYSQPNLRVVIPLTAEASCRYGRGTQWCTAATESANHFWNYASRGPLITVLVRDGNGKPRKYQMHFQANQFYDERDAPFRLSQLLRKHPQLKTILIQCAREAIEHGGYYGIPAALRTQELCHFAISRGALQLSEVSKALRTEELCQLAVSTSGRQLKYVPAALKTEAMCLAALKESPFAIEFVPKDLMTEEMVNLAVSKGGTLRYIPNHFKTEELCRRAVESSGEALQYVPKSLRSEALCRIAFEENVRCLPHIPRQFRSEERCRTAVAQYGWLISSVPMNMRVAVINPDQVDHILKNIPENARTEELCKMVVAKHGSSLEHVPVHLRTKEMCMLAVKRNGCSIQYVPTNLQTEAISWLAVSSNPYAIRFIPPLHKTAALYQTAVTLDGRMLEHVPIGNRTAALCEIACAKYDFAFFYTPEHLKTAELCRNAVRDRGANLSLVPESMRTEEICMLAAADMVRKLKEPSSLGDLEAFKAIPIHLQDKIAKATGLTFDENGFMVINDNAPEPTPRTFGRSGPDNIAAQLAA